MIRPIGSGAVLWWCLASLSLSLYLSLSSTKHDWAVSAGSASANPLVRSRSSPESSDRAVPGLGGERAGAHHFCADGGNAGGGGEGLSPMLCLRPTNPRGRLSLQTLGRRNHGSKEEKNHHAAHENPETPGKSESPRCCWNGLRNATAVSPPGLGGRNGRTLSPRSDAEPDTPGNATGTPGKDSSGLRLLSRRLDLLRAAERVRNNEIPLPQTIAGLFQPQAQPRRHIRIVAFRFDGAVPDSPVPPPPPPRTADSRSPRAGPGVDLTGRWRPARTISSSDLVDYEAFLEACCSDAISYWTRRLLASSSVVSRQELLAEQSDGGRFLELVDVHPLSSGGWNRTFVAGEGSADTVYRPRWNRLEDPQGNPILVQAYWQSNGTVHTTTSRPIDGGGGDTDGRKGSADDPGWVHTHMYLWENGSENESENEDERRVMVVETTFHSTPFPSAPEVDRITRFERDGGTSGGSLSEGTATRMAWRWEEVGE